MKLKEGLPIERAQMRIRVVAPVKLVNKMKKLLTKLVVTIEKEEVEGEELIMLILMDPGQYRTIEDNMKNGTQVCKQ